VAAVAVSPRRGAFERRLAPVPAFVLGAAAVVAMVAFQLVLTRAVQGEGDAERGHEAMVAAVEALKASRPAEYERRIQESRRAYERALRLRPLDAGLRLRYAAMLSHLLRELRYGNAALFDRTVGLYREAAELNRPSPSAHVRLAELFENAAEERARALLADYAAQYQASHPGPATRPIYLPAVAEYEAALGRDPDRPDLHLSLARALKRLGDDDAARQHATRALELHDLLTSEHSEHVLRLDPEEIDTARWLAGLPTPEMPKR
jgi:tetratricopeptide (TPR) repeat protein